jgi:hypothetical protein
MSVRTLVLDRVPADFGPDTHVALGPWCFFRAEELYPEWEALPFVEPFPTAAERAAGAEASRALSRALVERISLEMNRQHGMQHGPEYWHVVLMDWVLHVVMISWRLWCHVEAFKAAAGSEKLLVAVPGRDFPRLDDTWQLVHASYDSPEYCYWLSGLIVRELAPPSWTVVERAEKLVVDHSKRGRPPASRGRVRHIGGLRAWHEWPLRLVVALAPKKKARFGPLAEGSVKGFPPSFLKLMDQILEKTRPNYLGNGFREIAVAAEQRKYRPGRLDVTFVSPHFDLANIERAQAVEAGERIVNVQHGGLVQGGAQIAPLSAELEYCFDTYITWGWSEHPPYRGRFLPLPNPFLRMLEQQPKNPTQGIVMVGTMMPPFNPRFDYCANHAEYRRWKARFISSLGKRARDEFEYRPYVSESSFEDFDWLKRRFNWLRQWAGTNFAAALGSFRLIVLDHPSSTFAFAMAANVPTIGFWKQDDWLLSAVVMDRFKPLEEAGIWFNNPEKAAQQINAILPDVESWWRDPERQRVREQWCRYFAWSDRWWFWRWLKAFSSL